MSLRIRCWEGYDAAPYLRSFTAATGINAAAETLISDASAASALLNATDRCDVININNAYVQKVLDPAGCIAPLGEALTQLANDQLLAAFERFRPWMLSADGKSCIGVGQRFGAFNLVVNSRRVSRTLAEDEGFALAADPRARYGVLCYDDFNIFHIAIAAGFDPFQSTNERQRAAFSRTARNWFSNARLVSDDHFVLNRALLAGEIDFYLSGGVYTVSPARRDGHDHLIAITPRSGPVGGRGAIAFAEMTSVTANTRHPDKARAFVQHMLQPDNAVRIAFAETTCNPVAQMGNPDVLSAFSADDLAVIQWDTLAEDLSYCVDYDIVPDHGVLHGLLIEAMTANL